MAIDWNKLGPANSPSPTTPTTTVPVAPVAPGSLFASIPAAGATQAATGPKSTSFTAGTQAEVDAMGPLDRLGRGLGGVLDGSAFDTLGQNLFGQGNGSPLGGVPLLGDIVGGVGNALHGSLAAGIAPFEAGAGALARIPLSAGRGGADDTFRAFGDWAKTNDQTAYAEWEKVNIASNDDFLYGGNLKADWNIEFAKYLDDQRYESFLGGTPDIAIGAGGVGSVGGALSHAIQGFLGLAANTVQGALGSVGFFDPAATKLTYDQVKLKFDSPGKAVLDESNHVINVSDEAKVTFGKLAAGTITEQQARDEFAVYSQGGRTRVEESAGRMSAGLEASDVEQKAVQAWQAGAWSLQHANDYIVSHGQSITRNPVGQIVGGLFTDPQMYATLGTGAIIKAGVKGAVVAGDFAKGASLGEKLAQGAGAATSNIERLQTTIAAVRSDPILGPISRIGHGLIDPFATYKPSTVQKATTNMLSDVAVSAGGRTYGQAAIGEVRAMARKSGIGTEIDSAMASYFQDQGKLMVARTAQRDMLQGGMGEELVHSNVDDVIRPLSENAGRDAETQLTDHMQSVMKNTFTAEEDVTLASRIAMTFGGDSETWAKKLPTMSTELKSALHFVTYKRAEVEFAQARALVNDAAYTGDLPLGNMVLMTADTLDNIEAQNILDSIATMLKNEAEPQRIAAATAEWNAQAMRYPAMANIGHAPGGKEQLKLLTKELDRLLQSGGITRRALPEELADPALRPVQDMLDRHVMPGDRVGVAPRPAAAAAAAAAPAAAPAAAVPAGFTVNPYVAASGTSSTLPRDGLFHVTTATDAVRSEGFKGTGSVIEGFGSKGDATGRVSILTNRARSQTYLDRITLASKAARGEASNADVVNYFKPLYDKAYGPKADEYMANVAGELALKNTDPKDVYKLAQLLDGGLIGGSGLDATERAVKLTAPFDAAKGWDPSQISMLELATNEKAVVREGLDTSELTLAPEDLHVMSPATAPTAEYSSAGRIVTTEEMDALKTRGTELLNVPVSKTPVDLQASVDKVAEELHQRTALTEWGGATYSPRTGTFIEDANPAMYHGTSAQNEESIAKSGITRGDWTDNAADPLIPTGTTKPVAAKPAEPAAPAYEGPTSADILTQAEDDATALRDKVVTKWNDSGTKNGLRMEKDIHELEAQGFDVGDAEDHLGDYNGIERSDYTADEYGSREDATDAFKQDREDKWQEIVDALEQAEHNPSAATQAAADAADAASAPVAPVAEAAPAAPGLLYRARKFDMKGGTDKGKGWKSGARVTPDALEVSRDGGKTFEPLVAGTPPHDGPWVSAVGNTSSISIADAQDPAKFKAALDQFVADNAGELQKPGMYVGTFRDEKLGQVQFDVARATFSEADTEAVQAAAGRTGGAYNVSSGNGLFAPRLPGVASEAARSEAVAPGNPIWKVGFRPDEEVAWGLKRDAATGKYVVDRDPTISHIMDATPGRAKFSDTTRNVLGQVIGKSKAEGASKPIESIEAMVNTMRDGVTGQRLVRNIEMRFERSTFDLGVPKPMSKEIMTRAKDVAGLNQTTLRGVSPNNVWDAVSDIIPRDLVLKDGTTLNRHIVMDHLLQAAQGDLRIMGVTSVLSQRVRNALRKLGDESNWAGQMTVTMYNKVRYSQPVFLIQRITDSPYYSILYGVTPVGKGKLREANKALEAITDNLGRTGLARYFSMDMPEYATRSNFTQGIKSAMQEMGLKENMLNKISEAPNVIIANNMTNMLHGRLGDVFQGTLDNLARIAKETTDPTLRAEMEAAGSVLEKSVNDWTKVYSAAAGRPLSRNEVGLRYIQDQLNAARRVTVNADGTLDFTKLIHEGERFMPSDIGAIETIRPDQLAEELGYASAAALRRDVVGHTEKVNGAFTLVPGEHDIPWLEEQLRATLGAHPDYTKRALAYFGEDWGDFWGRLGRGVDEGGLDISAHYAKEAQDLIAIWARDRGMDPWEYLSGVMATNLGKDTLETHMGQLIGFLKTGKSKAPIEEWSRLFRGSLDVSAQQTLLKEFEGAAGAAFTDLEGTALKSIMEKDFPEAVRQRILTGAPHPNPEVDSYIQQFSKWVGDSINEGLGAQTRTDLRRLVEAVPHTAAAPFNRSHGLVVTLLKNKIEDSQADVFRLAEMQTKRTVIERSLNHPLFGLYPASYMWGKVLPETVKFLAKNPYAATYGIANVQRSIAIQREYDTGMDEAVSAVDRSAGAFLLDYLTPGLPWSDHSARMSPLVRGLMEGKDPGEIWRAELSTVSPQRWVNQFVNAANEIPVAIDAIAGGSKQQQESTFAPLQSLSGGTGPSAPPSSGAPLPSGEITGAVKAAALAPIIEDGLSRLQSILLGGQDAGEG